jgi:methyl-accepting chemotaxis protein
MKNLKTALTKIKTKIQNKFPEGNDIWGYQGISRDLLINTLEQIYTLATEIEGHDNNNRFEIIYLKRQASEINKSINDILDSEKPEDEFNTLLNRLAKLLWSVKHTFFVVNQNGLRSDEELALLKTQINSLQAANEELTNVQEEYNIAFDNFQEKIDTVADYAKGIEEKRKVVTDQVTEVNAKYESINAVHENIEGWDEEIEEKKNDFSQLTTSIKSLSADAEKLKENLSQIKKGAESTAETLKNLQTQNKDLLTEAKETLGIANRVGMASSFRTRKNELNVSLGIWGSVFVFAALGLAAIAYYLLAPEMKENIQWAIIFSRFTIAAPIVWLAWFSAKQYLSISRIKEDYAFKFAAAMAYEGHKKATRELEDEELEKALLIMSLCNMEENPIRLYSKVSHASPINEILGTLRKVKTKLGIDNLSVDVETQSDVDE